ncbi:hypothetical protein D3C71_2030750 [compost metagenome]
MNEMLNKYQATVISGYTGILMIRFAEYHADVEKRIGRPVWTHEFGNKEFSKEVKTLYKEEFLSICYLGDKL